MFSSDLSVAESDEELVIVAVDEAVAKVEDVMAVAVWSWNAPIEVDVTLGAVELLQQFRRSLLALQQYVPKSHVWMFHAGTGLRPSNSFFTAIASVRYLPLSKRLGYERTARA